MTDKIDETSSKLDVEKSTEQADQPVRTVHGIKVVMFIQNLMLVVSCGLNDQSWDVFVCS